MSNSRDTYDYIVVGGGTAGCVLASRLHRYLPSLDILILGRGADDQDHPLVTALPSPELGRSCLVSKYQTVPQPRLNGRQIRNAAGNLLSGSSGVNYGAWLRGHRGDYDRWGDLAGDELGKKRFGYDGLLPYFKRVERHHGPGEGWDRDQFGTDGPIHTTPWRGYPIREVLKSAIEDAGFVYNPNYHAGEPVGYAEYMENWYQGSRQPAAKAYDLTGVDVRKGCVVRRVVLEQGQNGVVARGVELVDGSIFRAKNEVLVACGSFKTPQLLMLSGIGPVEDLQKMNIKQVVVSPDVGRNLWDHLTYLQGWKIKQPTEGWAVGSEKFNKAEYALGLPAEWIVGYEIPRDVLAKGVKGAADHLPDRP